MQSEKKNRSFFQAKTYEDFRRFLKINFYYCSLSQEQQALFIKAIGTTRYNEFKNITESFAGEKIEFPKINSRKAFRYNISQLESDYNVLADSFQLKTLTSFDACLTIFIILLLTDKELRSSDIIKRAGDIYPEIDVKTVNDKLKHMYEYGMISINDRKYCHTENSFYSVDTSLLLKLTNMADFMKNLVYPNVAGYDLFAVLKSIYEERTGKAYLSPFQFKYSHLANILDDNVLWTLEEAISDRKYVYFDYNGKKKEKLIPVKIFTENEYNRCYLFAVKKFRNSFKFFVFRLSSIYNLKCTAIADEITEEDHERFLEAYNSEKKYSFFGKIDSSDGTDTVELKYKRGLRSQLERDFNCIRFGKNCTALVTVKSKRMMIPYLRANMGHIQTTDEELVGILNEDIEEMKKNYGIIS